MTIEEDMQQLFQLKTQIASDKFEQIAPFLITHTIAAQYMIILPALLFCLVSFRLGRLPGLILAVSILYAFDLVAYFSTGRIGL